METDRIQKVIIEEMTGLDDWMERYEYLIEQGKNLNHHTPAIRNDDNALAGCQSQVWIDAELHDGCVHFLADSDAQITRGILALLLRVLDRRTPDAIVDTELFFVEQTGLKRHLSPARGNGLAAVIAEMKRRARRFRDEANP